MLHQLLAKTHDGRRYVIDRHMAWLCISTTALAGVVWGLVLGVLIFGP